MDDVGVRLDEVRKAAAAVDHGRAVDPLQRDDLCGVDVDEAAVVLLEGDEDHWKGSSLVTMPIGLLQAAQGVSFVSVSR